MWWLDPGKEVLNVLFNRVLAPYVENLDLNQVNYGIGQGQLTLRNLRLKKGALDKFRLPVDVLEGHLGKFTLSLHWMNLGNQPVEVMVEDVYLLVVPSPQSNDDPEEDEKRVQAAKAERLENAELLHMRGQAESSSGMQRDTQESQGLVQSLMAKIINNLQVTVKNIHIRYEDKLSVPGHPFAAGVTLAGFTAVSVNGKWQPAFIESTAGAIHKACRHPFLANLQSLAVYFDTDSPSMAGLSPADAISKFSSLISTSSQDTNHQFILKPVSGEGRVIMNHKFNKDTPQFDVQLLFDEIGVALDDKQYRDIISLVDMYHVYMRQHQYRKFRPPEAEFAANAPNTGSASRDSILEGVATDDANGHGPTLRSVETTEINMSIARSRLRKDMALRKKLEQDRSKEQAAKQGWGAWLGWGASTTRKKIRSLGRKQLYDVLDYDEKEAVIEGLATPRDTMKARIVAKLNKGSFALKRTLFSGRQSRGLSVTRRFGVFDGTTKNSLYPQIVQVKDLGKGDPKLQIQVIGVEPLPTQEPFLFVKFEHNPLDERADNALTVRMRHMSIIYHKGYVEAVYKFFKPAKRCERNVGGPPEETRIGLEFALQNHKTIDIQMDLNAPVIIVPEDVTTHNCKHLIIDAGHIAIESNLADKDAIRAIHLKRNKQYSDEDYKQLESLMYDKFSLRLEAAQASKRIALCLALTYRLPPSCQDALTSDAADSLHLLERTNFDLQVQNSIVPTAFTLARFKVSGHLPSLQVNLSDTKYKALMRLIDVCIPKLGDDVAASAPPPLVKNGSNAFQIPSGLFGQSETEYNVADEDDAEEDDDDASAGGEDKFFEATDGDPIRPELHQHVFELNFQVDNLRASLAKTGSDGVEKTLGDVELQRFGLMFALAKFDMKVDVNLRSLSMSVVQPTANPIKFVSSPESDLLEDKDLLSLTYRRVQKESPEFLTIYEGIDQSVDIKLSTFIFRAAPEPVLSLYDFIMTTFVPQPDPAAIQSPDASPGVEPDLARKLRQVVKSVFSSSSPVYKVTGRLGSLALSNDSPAHPVREEFSQILSIEGQNFADFRYQTYDPDEDTYTGVKSSLAKLKGLYDAATQVAVQRASEIERMAFDISVKTPIIVFPSDPNQSRDVLVLRLGEITAKNSYEDVVNKTTASLTGIQLASNLYAENDLSTLKIVDDIDINADVVQTSGIDRNNDNDYPDTQLTENQISIKISDVRLLLTQVQYVLLIRLSQSIPRVFSGGPDAPSSVQPAPSTKSVSQASDTQLQPPALVDLQPELKMVSDGSRQRPWTTLDLVVVVNVVKLHLYDALATNTSNLKEHGIARFALNNNTLRLKMLSDGAGEAQVVLKSFTVGNTRPGSSKFREIIPAAQHDRNQFMVLYTMSGGSNLAVLTVDSPQVIFAVDPVIALLQFFTSAFAGPPADPANEETVPTVEVAQPQSQTTIDFRVDLHDVSVSVLENDSIADSPAMKLTINQVLLSQQASENMLRDDGVMALTVNRLGMSLIRMGKPSESVRFLDDVDLTFSLDSRSSDAQQMTSIEISAKPIVFRASYRDINMIMTIVNKAIELSADTQDQSFPDEINSKPPPSVRPSQTQITKMSTSKQPVGKARVLMSKELLKGSFDGFRLVLIGDMHEQPMLHLKVKPFIIGAKDWSGELQATTTMATQISYWNLANSHWEPLAMTTLNTWAKQGTYVLQKARGSYAPYRISNRTDGSTSAKDVAAVKIPNDETVDWRFDDWKTMREHVPSSGQHSVGLQFDGKPWEQLRSIPVDREGEYIFTLRPRTEKYPHRLLVEVKVVDTVKVVTLRSTFKIENLTLYPIELTLVDDAGHPVQSLEKVAPGEQYSLPIEAVTLNKVRIQPDQGFGYKWCPAICWEDLLAKRNFTIKCPHTDPREAAFRFQAWVQTDMDDASSRKYPKINLKLRAPVELENCFHTTSNIVFMTRIPTKIGGATFGRAASCPSIRLNCPTSFCLTWKCKIRPSDFAIINTNPNSDFDIEKKLSLRDSNDRKLDLRLNYVRYPDSGGAFKVQIYSPYLIVNKMGLPFGVRSRSGRTGSPQDVAGDTRSGLWLFSLLFRLLRGVLDVLAQPHPFMLSHPNDKGHDYIFRVGESTWSKVFSFEAPSAETELVVASERQKTDEIHIGVSWTEGLGKYKLTKVITLAPRFLIKNNLSEALSFREHGVAPRERSIIKPGERCPLHWMRAEQERLLTIAFSGLNAQWSPPINIEHIGSVHLRLRYPGREQDPVELIRGDVKIEGPTIFISFSRATESWPFMIENHSDYTATISQKFLFIPEQDSSLEEEGASKKTNVQEKKILLSINGFRRVVDVMEIGDLVPFKFNDGQRNRVVSLDVRADGQKQVLRISNYNPERSLYKPKRASSMPLSRQDSISASTEAFDAVTEEVPPSLAFTVDFAGIGISLVNKKMVEVIYVSMLALKFEYSNSAVAQTVNLSCGTLQIDNQLHDALYPVILQPTPIPKESNGTSALPTVQASVIWLKDQAHGVLFVKYCSILLQALTIEADEDLLFSIYDLTQIKGASWEEGVADVLIQNEGEIQEPTDTAAGEDLYFEVLELQPIKLSLSFMRTERVTAEEKLSIRNPLAVVINAITMAVGNINDAPLEMNALAIKDMRLTMPELQTRIVYHYRQDVLRQLYRILGSADFIGNPVGLFNNVSSGVADIFYEPFNGVVMHGNKELGIGIAKGAASFVKKTVFGVSDSMTKFTSSVGKGLSAATFDSEYQQRRKLNQRRNKPRHAIYGVAAGGEALASSVASAMEGVLMKPIEGAESGGAFGFFKGVGKGLVGASAVTKPVVGVFDLASNVSEGIRNTTTVFDVAARDRVRLPRHVSADGCCGHTMHERPLGNIGCGISTMAHIVRKLMWRTSKTEARLGASLLPSTGVTVEDTGIRFAHKSGRSDDKFVFIQDKASQSWFFSQVATVVKSFNAKKGRIFSGTLANGHNVDQYCHVLDLRSD
ncbi:hypothetical protein K438DRAFT_1748990 [Mycena galopus ATCC 62051]|nr:hypothetical protein K438DRAFT_1748990 [Mycena galopus ATCC 62051]